MRGKQSESLDDILGLLRNHGQEFHRKFKARELAVFGSFLRGDQNSRSDVDILVEFAPGGKTFDNYMELKIHLEEILGRKVDLITKSGLRSEIKRDVLSEAVYV